MLKSRSVFPLEMLDPNSLADEPVDVRADCEEFLARDPAPGIDPIPEAKVVKVGPSYVSEHGDEMVVAHVEMSVEAYIRMQVQYGVDAYHILDEVRKFCGADAAQASFEFMRDSTDLSVAIVGGDGEGGVKSDQWPKQPEL